jgi:hypothetical protein
MAKALAKKRLGAEGGIWRSKNIRNFCIKIKLKY